MNASSPLVEPLSAVVTGGARGIGRGIAERLVQRGYAVVLTDIDGDAARRTASEVGASEGLAQDVRDEDSHVAVAEAAGRYGRLAVWVNNAGVGDPGSLGELSSEAVHRVVDVNLKGVLWGMRAALEAFGARPGDIVNISSLSAMGPVPGLTVYAATKSAVLSATMSAALEAPRQVGVHVLSGEYDYSGRVDLGRAAHEAIAGSTFTEMHGIGHFPMSGHPAAFIEHLLPVLRGLVRDGTTLLLTTQYLEEADHLADDIVVIDKGRVIAAGTPTQLKDQAGRASVVLTLTNTSDLARAADLVRSCSPEIHVEHAARRITAQAGGLGDMTRIGEVIAEAGDGKDAISKAEETLANDGRLVIIELKCTPDRETVFQAADYWRKVELQRRKGELAKAGLFEGREIIDRPALVYVAAPALSFHRDFEEFARMLAPEIELWRWELHEDWREDLRVIGRRRAEN